MGYIYTMELYVKNMVCQRCIKVVREGLQQLGVPVAEVQLGLVRTQQELPTEKLAEVREQLAHNGFELIDDKRTRLIEQTKTLIIESIHHNQAKPEHLNYSDYLAQNTQSEYGYLSQLFSSVEGITIERYVILQKIERVKELLFYGEKTLSEISYALGYSSVQHLSGQFKKVTGLTPSQFKEMRQQKRNFIDHINVSPQ